MGEPLQRLWKAATASSKPGRPLAPRASSAAHLLRHRRGVLEGVAEQIFYGRLQARSTNRAPPISAHVGRRRWRRRRSFSRPVARQRLKLAAQRLCYFLAHLVARVVQQIGIWRVCNLDQLRQIGQAQREGCESLVFLRPVNLAREGG